MIKRKYYAWTVVDIKKFWCDLVSAENIKTNFSIDDAIATNRQFATGWGKPRLPFLEYKKFGISERYNETDVKEWVLTLMIDLLESKKAKAA
jgi:hypothetical protein